MKFERTIKVPVSESDAITRAQAYLEKAGYKADSRSRLKYKRGSILGTLTSFSPRSSHATATLTTQPLAANSTTVNLKIEVNTTGQILSESDLDFWNTEINGVEAAMKSGRIEAAPAEHAAQAVKKSSWITVFVTVAVGLLAIVLATEITGKSQVVNTGIFVFIGLAVGLIAAQIYYKKRKFARSPKKE